MHPQPQALGGQAVRWVAGLLAAGMVAALQAADLPASEAAKIEYLIGSVAELRDAQFIRNGTPHDSQAAADHLRRKLKAAGKRVKTAEDFIRLCASRSSMTGKPYRIRYSGGREVDAEEFFERKLSEYSAGTPHLPRRRSEP
jgi:hypothetical protein